jgi:diguanylate cyclase (GGDEF)-like protein
MACVIAEDAESKPVILLVDDDPGAIELMAGVLAGEGALRFAMNGSDALRLARAAAPDLILLDAEMPEMGGFEVCAALKEEPVLADIPVIFVTSHRNESFEVAGFAAGAVDFIAKPINPQLVVARVRSQLRIKRMADELRRNATIDGLTGIANRRRLDELLEREWLRARRSREPLALALVDIDHFKSFNDQYGHQAGDACLRAVAKALRSVCLRPCDLCARYGGEEFALLLPQTPALGAQHVARRILDCVEALAIPHAGSTVAPHLTVSAGIACCDGTGGGRAATPGEARGPRGEASIRELIGAADAALYAAKGAGRAQVCVVVAREDASGELRGDFEGSQRVASTRRSA